MADLVEVTPEMEAAYAKWVEERPPVVKEIAARTRPWKLYRMKSTGQRVTIAAISEDGTVRVDVTGDYNLVLMARSVFGINPDDLEECDIPDLGEPTGELLTRDEAEESRDAIRCLVRPDIWEMGADGKAVRRVKH